MDKPLEFKSLEEQSDYLGKSLIRAFEHIRTLYVEVEILKNKLQKLSKKPPSN